MKKFSLLLLDANVVIEISRLGLWTQLVLQCEIWLAQTVIDEAEFYVDENGDRQTIDLTEFIKIRAIRVFECLPSETKSLRDGFSPGYLGRLDAGETESLAYLLKQPDNCQISSSDQIVFRILGNLNRSDQGVSLEEILSKVGLGRKLAWRFTRDARERWTKEGFTDGLGGVGKIKT